MTNEMRGISRCGECYHYSWEKHKCKVCSCEGNSPKAPFYDDCPLPKVVEVVRCKDCIYARKLRHEEKRIYVDGVLVCENPDVYNDEPLPVFEAHYCSYGEAKSGTQPQREV